MTASVRCKISLERAGVSPSVHLRYGSIAPVTRYAFALLVPLLLASPISAQTQETGEPLLNVSLPALTVETVSAGAASLSGWPLAPPDLTAVAEAAQAVPKPAGPPPTPEHTGVHALLTDLVGDIAHLPSKENLAWAAIGGGLALSVHPADHRVNRTMVDSNVAHHVFKPGAILGQSYTLFALSGAVFVTGRVRHQPKVSHVGMDLIQALVISEGITQGLKYAARRDRPDGSGKTSFPSGHAADTFAFATALERHLGWKGALPAYAFSSYVAISRLPANRHWLSDAVFGSAVGIIAGRTVTRHGRKYPVSAAFVPGGIAVVYQRASL
jgi:membrane-associated phospholipid phosphatase